MRIPGLRTGFNKNPVGFATRAALNDKSTSSDGGGFDFLTDSGNVSDREDSPLDGFIQFISAITAIAIGIVIAYSTCDDNSEIITYILISVVITFIPILVLSIVVYGLLAILIKNLFNIHRSSQDTAKNSKKTKTHVSKKKIKTVIILISVVAVIYGYFFISPRLFLNISLKQAQKRTGVIVRKVHFKNGGFVLGFRRNIVIVTENFSDTSIEKRQTFSSLVYKGNTMLSYVIEQIQDDECVYLANGLTHEEQMEQDREEELKFQQGSEARRKAEREYLGKLASYPPYLGMSEKELYKTKLGRPTQVEDSHDFHAKVNGARYREYYWNKGAEKFSQTKHLYFYARVCYENYHSTDESLGYVYEIAYYDENGEKHYETMDRKR